MSIDDESKRKLSDILHGIKSSDANIYINVFLQSLKCDAFAISPSLESARGGFDRLIADYNTSLKNMDDQSRGIRKAFAKLFALDTSKRSAFLQKCTAKIIESQLSYPTKNVQRNIAYLSVLTTLQSSINLLLHDDAVKASNKLLALRKEHGI